MLWSPLFEKAFLPWLQPATINLAQHGMPTQHAGDVIAGLLGQASSKANNAAVALMVALGMLIFVLKSKELERILGSRVAIKRKVEAGELQALGSGIYSSPALDPMIAAALAVAKFFPRAVLSGRTALFIHKLSDHGVERLDVDIAKTTSLNNRMLEVHRVAPSRLTGITKLKLEGQPVRIYDLERTLCESYRLDPAGPEFFTALKRYLKQKEPDTLKIKKYDKVLGTNVLMHVMQEKANG